MMGQERDSKAAEQGKARGEGEKVMPPKPEDLVDETDEESFPASDPPESYHVD